MKRLFYSTVAVLAFSVSSMANTIELDKTKTDLQVLEIENTINHSVELTKEDVGSVKCWGFGRLLRHKLNQISDDEELIDQIVDAAVTLCNILDDLELI